MVYEFDTEDSLVIKAVGLKALAIAVLMSLGGLLKAIFTVIDDRDDLIVLSFRLVQAVIQIGAGWIFLRPSDNLRRIHDTEGNDIAELMTGIEEMSMGFLIAIFLVVLSLVMDLGLFLSEVF